MAWTEEELITDARRWQAIIRRAGLTAAEWRTMTYAESSVQGSRLRPRRRGNPVFRGGKWLVFCSPEHHADVWGKIKSATEAGELGDSAKTVPPLLPQRVLLTSVYTYDAEDLDDVRRVLVALRGLGFSGRLSYKRDEDTARGDYGDGIAIYVSQPGALDFEDRRERRDTD